MTQSPTHHPEPSILGSLFSELPTLRLEAACPWETCLTSPNFHTLHTGLLLFLLQELWLLKDIWVVLWLALSIPPTPHLLWAPRAAATGLGVSRPEPCSRSDACLVLLNVLQQLRLTVFDSRKDLVQEP